MRGEAEEVGGAEGEKNPPCRGGQAIREETRDERIGQPRSEKRKESFMPVEITGAWVRAEKGIGGRIVLGWIAPGSLRWDSGQALRLGSGQAEAPAS